MSLIKCTECGKDFSDKAAACPNCGCPTEEVVRILETESISQNSIANKSEKTAYKLLKFQGQDDIDLAEIVREFPKDRVKAITTYRSKTKIGLVDAKNQLDRVYDLPKINCKSCKRSIFENDEYCKFCGQVQQNNENLFRQIENSSSNSNIISNQPHCPKCGSSQIAAKSKGFGVGKAAVGAILVGPIGLLGGAIGSNNTIIVCLACGNEWNAGQ